MFKTTMLGTILTGTLILGAGAQDPGVGPAWTATLREHVDGDPRAAIAELEIQLDQATGDERALLLAKLSVLHRMVGEADASLARLRQLEAVEGPYAAWARTELDQAAPQEAPSRVAQDPEIPAELQNMVRQVQSRWARQELGRLGSLAIPAIIKAVDERELSVSETRQALDLIISYDDARVADALRRMLESEDPILQTVAAEFTPRLAGAGRRELGRFALEAEASIVRLHGVEALINAEEVDETLRATLAELMEDQSTQVRRELAQLLGNLDTDLLPIDGWLARLARDGNSDVYVPAIHAWLSRRAADESERRIALFESLPRPQAGKMLEVALEDARFKDEALFVRAVEFRNYYAMILGAVSDPALASAPDFLRAILATRSRQYCERALTVIRQQRLEELIPEVAVLLAHEGLDSSAFRVLEELQPELLLARAADLLDGGLARSTAILLADHGGTEHVPLMVEAVRRGLTGGSSPFATTDVGVSGAPGGYPLLRAVAMRSDASNLEVVLDLVTIPDLRILPADWSSRRAAVREALGRWFDRESIVPSLRRVRHLDYQIAERVLDLTERHVSFREADVVADLLEDVGRDELVSGGSSRNGILTPLGTQQIALSCVQILGAAGGNRARSALRSLIRDPMLGDLAFGELLAMEGEPDLELLTEVLADESLWHLMETTLGRPQVVENEELRGMVERRLLSWDLAQDAGARRWLGRLPSEDRKRISIAILDRLREGTVPSASLVMDALRVLADEKDGALVETLALGLRSENSTVRLEAVRALQQTFAKEAAPYLIESLKDDQGDVVEAAQAALVRLSEYFAEKEKWEKAFGIKKDG